MKECVQDCFVPTISQNDELADSNEDVLLLLDSWSGHWSKGVWENVAPKNVNLKTEKIPEGCTSRVQPLDVGVNSYYKYIIKRITDFVILENIECTLAVRENLVKLISLSFNQLAAPIFVPLIKYSWVKSGNSPTVIIF